VENEQNHIETIDNHPQVVVQQKKLYTLAEVVMNHVLRVVSSGQ